MTAPVTEKGNPSLAYNAQVIDFPGVSPFSNCLKISQNISSEFLNFVENHFLFQFFRY